MTTQTFVYGAKFEPGEKRGVVVSFPDVPEAITQGRDAADAMEQAEEALALALLSYPERGLPVPKARARGRGLTPVSLDPEAAAKIALLDALRERDLSKSAFARMIGKDEREVRRMLDPYHATKMATLAEALRALNRRMVVAVEEAYA